MNVRIQLGGVLARDNFNKLLIDKLQKRVGLRCSNPDCRVPTSAPSSNDKVNSIGIAAHISAASPGGPRYDKLMSSSDRKSINNAIWLCSNCSIDIDRDETKYPPFLLKGWKELAENSARSELGKKLPHNTDAINTVVAALAGSAKNYIPNAISNVHQATEKTLELLDPRFLIKSSHNDGKTSFQLYPKENISLKMKIKGEKAKEFSEKHQQLIEHGKDINFELKAISIEGSQLFSKIFDNDGKVNIESKKILATQKLWLVQKETNVIESFDDIQGLISFGTQSFTFDGKACNKLFIFNYQKTLKKGDNKANIKMYLCMDEWEGINLRLLAYFDKIKSLYSKMAQGWELFTSLEVYGKEVFRSEGMVVDKWEYVLDTTNFLHYISRAKIVADFSQQDISYTSNVSFTAEEHKHLADVVEIIEGKQTFDEGNISSNATCDLIADEKCRNIRMLKELVEPMSIKMIQQQSEEIKLFDVIIKIPRKIIYLSSVVPKITADLDKLKCNDVIKVEWVPKKNFNCLVCYES